MLARLRSWLRGRSRTRGAESRPVAELRQTARRLASSGSAAEIEAALARAARLPACGDAFELEVEMLQARRDALRLEDRIAREGLPAVATQHKALGRDVCHLLAPASLVGEGEDDTAGKLLLTSRRLLFLGGRGLSLGWSRLRSVVPEGRDLLVDTAARGVHRLRCNTHGEAATAAVVARALIERCPRGD
jgi:hypothetical protein